MSGQIPTVPCTLMSIMRHVNFRQGLEDVRAGRPPRFDNFFDEPWAYERGRQFGYVAPISMRLFINGRINLKAMALFELAYARKIIL